MDINKNILLTCGAIDYADIVDEKDHEMGGSQFYLKVKDCLVLNQVREDIIKPNTLTFS